MCRVTTGWRAGLAAFLVALVALVLGVSPTDAGRAEATVKREVVSDPLPPGKVKGPGRPTVERDTQAAAKDGTPRDKATDKLRAAAKRREAKPAPVQAVPEALRAAEKKRPPASELTGSVMPGDEEHSQRAERSGRSAKKGPSLGTLAAPESEAAAAAATYGASYSILSGWSPAPSYFDFGVIKVRACNSSSFTWTTANHSLGYHLYYSSGAVYNFVGGWTSLPANIAPGYCADVWVWVENLAAGSFKIVFDMYESSTSSWFTDHGVPASTAASFTVPHYPPRASLDGPLNNATTSTLDQPLVTWVGYDGTRPVDIYYEMCGTLTVAQQCWNSGWRSVPIYGFGVADSWLPPTSAMRWNVTYQWRVRLRENTTTSAFSAWSYFTPVVAPPAGSAHFGTDPSAVDAAGVNMWLGNFTRVEKDLALPGVGLPLEITRTYNSANTTAGLFGLGWSSSTVVPAGSGIHTPLGNQDRWRTIACQMSICPQDSLPAPAPSPSNLTTTRSATVITGQPPCSDDVSDEPNRKHS